MAVTITSKVVIDANTAIIEFHSDSGPIDHGFFYFGSSFQTGPSEPFGYSNFARLTDLGGGSYRAPFSPSDAGVTAGQTVYFTAGVQLNNASYDRIDDNALVPPLAPPIDHLLGASLIQEFLYKTGTDKELIDKINDIVININLRNLGPDIALLVNDEIAREFYYKSGSNSDFVNKLNEIIALLPPLTPMGTSRQEFGYKSGADQEIVEKINEIITKVNSL